MDPICHTLVGACLAQSGLKRRARLGTAALVVAANAPDVDIVAGFLGRSLELRRGITHGVPALLIWPFVIAGVLWLIGRARGGEPARFRPLAGLAAIGVLTHPALDYLNTYGMRWLMPLVDRWFYGDTLFIIDPWVWLALAAGVLLVRRRERRVLPDPSRPARIALAAVAVYIGAMMTSTLMARRDLARMAGPDARVMVAPRPVDPLTKSVVVARGDWYLVGSYRFGRSPAARIEDSVPVGLDQETIAAVAAAPGGPAFLHWARFPVGRRTQLGDSTRYLVYDRRYSSWEGGWASFEVTLPNGR
ncbi:MAG: metal-dependent hydrolase [Gemmatimonadales bacterium]